MGSRGGVGVGEVRDWEAWLTIVGDIKTDT